VLVILLPIPDNNSNFENVVYKTTVKGVNPTPHCEKHGAMNKVSCFKMGGYWRCCTTENTICRSGCIMQN